MHTRALEPIEMAQRFAIYTTLCLVLNLKRYIFQIIFLIPCTGPWTMAILVLYISITEI